MTAADIAKRIADRSFTVGVIGLGYVGLPLILRFVEEGFPVIGFDVDPEKVRLLSAGRSYIRHIPAARIRAALPRLTATADMGRLSEPDAVIVCVPTPLDPHREPDMRFIRKSAADIAAVLRRGQIVSLESTTYPGTTREILLPLFERTGLRVGRDYFLVFSPEREDPGNPRFETRSIPKLIGGVTPACRAAGTALYGAVIERVVPVSSPEVAEASKLLENIYRAVNIALVNELKVLFTRMGIDVWEVIEAAKTKPFGFQAFYPGPGLGGHCIPVDPFYLTWKAREYDFHTRFIELAGEINTSMPYHVAARTVEALNGAGRSVKGARILLVGLAYKKDVDDCRESPSFKVLKLLRDLGARVDCHDPYVREIRGTRQFEGTVRSVGTGVRTLRRYDAAVIVTDHSCVDYAAILENIPVVVDTRNVYRKAKRRVVKA